MVGLLNVSCWWDTNNWACGLLNRGGEGWTDLEWIARPNVPWVYFNRALVTRSVRAGSEGAAK